VAISVFAAMIQPPSLIFTSHPGVLNVPVRAALLDPPA